MAAQAPPPSAPSNVQPAPAPGSGGASLPLGGMPSNSDENVHFDQTTGKWQFEDPETGAEFEYDESLQRWKRLVDEGEWKQQQDAYSVTGVDEERPAGAVERRMNKKKRKQLEGATDPNSITAEPTSSSLPVHEDGLKSEQRSQQVEASNSNSSAKAKSTPGQRERVNSSLYLSRLPLDATSEEIAKVFSRYGIIAEDDEGAPRIKLYTDARTGMFKGEALLTYFKPESCQLAIQLLDATCLRAAEGQSKPQMKVEMADWSRSARETAGSNPVASAANDKQEGSSHASSSKDVAASDTLTSTTTAQSSTSSKRPRTEADKKRAAKRFARMNDKLTGWESDSDEETAASLRPSGIRAGFAHPTSRVAVLKRMFTLAELEEDPSLLLDLKADVRDECNDTIGQVTSVTLWDQEPEGVMTVKFKDVEDARECVKRMDGRYFAQRRIEAFLAEGNKVRYRRSRGAGGQDDDDDDDDDDDQDKDGTTNNGGTDQASKERQDKFGEWLEAGGDDEGP